jgi:dUTPase
MKGRGTRTISNDALQMVSKTAKAKTHFIIVDAVGVTKSKKTDSRPLERKPTISLKDLLGAVTMGVAEEDLFLSLANRLIRLEKEITDKEKEKLLEHSKGKNLKQISKELLSAFDDDVIGQTIRTGVVVAALKEDYTPAPCMLLPRSSLSATPLRLSNSIGLIDMGYRGEVLAKVDCVNDRFEDYEIQQGKRLFQIVQYNWLPWKNIVLVERLEDLPQAPDDRGAGGFGSTGR